MSPTQLKLISSMATRELLRELVALYSSRTSQAVMAEAAGGVDVAKRVQAGDPADVVVLAGGAIDQLIGDGRLLPGSRVDLVKSGVAIAVRSGAARPDVGTEEALKTAVLAATSLSYSTGPSGVHLEKVFERWGVLEAIRARIHIPPPGVPVASLIADGSAAIGFQQLSELMNVAGIEVLGPLPDAIQIMTVFAGGVSSASARPEAARALLAFMASSAVASIKRRHGMDGI